MAKERELTQDEKQLGLLMRKRPHKNRMHGFMFDAAAGVNKALAELDDVQLRQGGLNNREGKLQEVLSEAVELLRKARILSQEDGAEDDRLVRVLGAKLGLQVNHYQPKREPEPG